MLRNNHNGFRKNRSTTGQILTVRRILEGVRVKNLEAVLLFIHRGKMANILKAYGIPGTSVDAIMALYDRTNAIVRSPDGDTDPFKCWRSSMHLKAHWHLSYLYCDWTMYPRPSQNTQFHSRNCKK